MQSFLLCVDTTRYFSNSSSPARLVAFTTALISVTRSLPSSSSNIPSIVQPAGVVTASFSCAGCSPVSSTTLAAPFIVWAASSVATSRGKPTFTPASASDSKIMYANAGPLAESPVTASIFFSSTTTVRPTASNMARAVSRCSAPAWAPRQIPVIPHRPHDWHFPAQTLLDVARRHRRCDGDHQHLRRQLRCDFLQHLSNHLGLHTQQDDIRF